MKVNEDEDEQGWKTAGRKKEEVKEEEEEKGAGGGVNQANILM